MSKVAVLFMDEHGAVRMLGYKKVQYQCSRVLGKTISQVFGDNSQKIAKIPLSLPHGKLFSKK